MLWLCLYFVVAANTTTCVTKLSSLGHITTMCYFVLYCDLNTTMWCVVLCFWDVRILCCVSALNTTTCVTMLCPLGHLWTLESPMRHTLPGNWGLRTGMPSLTNTAANTPPSLTYTIMLDICYGTVQLRSTWTVFQIVNSSAQQSGRQLSDIVIDCWHAGHLVSSKQKNKKDQKEEGGKVQLLNIVDMPMQQIRFPKKSIHSGIYVMFWKLIFHNIYHNNQICVVWCL